MNKPDLVNLSSSNGFVTSVADENIVVPPEPNMTAFAWKQLSIVASQTCQVEINGNTDNPSTLTLAANLSLQIDNMNINSFKFKQSGISYYYIAGY